MDKLFLTILNMSLTGAFVIAAICLARLPLKKAPKIISYCLWAVAGFRLVFPFSIESGLSLIPFKASPVESSLIGEGISLGGASAAAWEAVGDTLNGGIGTVTMYLEKAPPGGLPVTVEVSHREAWIAFGGFIWPVGVAVMLIYGVATYLLLKRKMRGAAHIDGNIYSADNIQSPFVLGILNPKIYLPTGLSEQEKSYIILHEQTHILRRDHIVKFAAYFILCLHWFNPLAWAAFLLMGVDMEMSCDERVLKEMGGETKKDYSLSLVSLATGPRVIGGSPLAFSESGLKARIKNILNFRKPSRIILVAAVALVAVLSVGFAVNRAVRQNYSIPYFTAGGLTLGYYVEDMDLTLWNRSDVEQWDYTNEFGSFRVNSDGRIDLFTANIHTFYDGIWIMSGIQPKDRAVNDFTFAVPTAIDDILDRFGEETERYDAPDNSKDIWSYVRYEDRQTGITVRVDFRKENGQIVYVTAEGLPPLASRPTPAPTAGTLIDTVSIIIWKDDNGQNRYALFEGEAASAPPELPNDGAFNDINELNSALAVYRQGYMKVHVKHTSDFTKEEMLAITDTFVIPSDNYVLSTGVYIPNETIMPPDDALSPTEIVRQELLNDGCKITYVFLMSQGERKSLQGVDNGELATVYASYTEGEYGDAIYCMRYDFERADTDSPWTHSEPTYWDGVAIDVAAYVARGYFAEQTGVNYDDVVVSWAYQELDKMRFSITPQFHYAAFYIGEDGDTPTVIILASPDGQSHWTVIGYDGAGITQ